MESSSLERWPNRFVCLFSLRAPETLVAISWNAFGAMNGASGARHIYISRLEVASKIIAQFNTPPRKSCDDFIAAICCCHMYWLRLSNQYGFSCKLLFLYAIVYLFVTGLVENKLQFCAKGDDTRELDIPSLLSQFRIAFFASSGFCLSHLNLWLLIATKPFRVYAAWNTCHGWMFGSDRFRSRWMHIAKLWAWRRRQ